MPLPSAAIPAFRSRKTVKWYFPSVATPMPCLLCKRCNCINSRLNVASIALAQQNIPWPKVGALILHAQARRATSLYRWPHPDKIAAIWSASRLNDLLFGIGTQASKRRLRSHNRQLAKQPTQPRCLTSEAPVREQIGAGHPLGKNRAASSAMR